MTNVARAMRCLLMIAMLLPPGVAGAQGNVASLTRAQFDAMLARVDNSARWGSDDELGTLNFITADVRRAAAAEVRDGKSVSLAREIVAGSEGGFIPTTIDFLYVPDSVLGPSDNSVMWSGEKIGVFYHGWTHTHIDALSHMTYRGRAYNGRSVTRHQGPPDYGRIGLMRDGLITRGVLVDVPRLRATQRAAREAPLSVEDLVAWERQAGIRIRPGDIVMIRSGRWESAKPPARSAGVHPSVAEWLRERKVAAFGDEGGTDMTPSPVSGINSPFHVLAIVGMGMPLIENLDLEQLASEAAKRSRWTFMFVAAPLRIQSGTGSPLNPLAVF